MRDVENKYFKLSCLLFNFAVNKLVILPKKKLLTFANCGEGEGVQPKSKSFKVVFFCVALVVSKNGF